MLSVIENLVIIFGWGKFGHKAFTKFKNDYNILIIDSTTADAKELESMSITVQNNNEIEKIINLYSSQSTNSEYKIYDFILGSISELAKILNKITPKYLVPTAPIHLMAEYVKYIYSDRLRKDQGSFESSDILSYLENEKPENMNIGGAPPASIYYSYAKADEICSDNCFGPESYCPVFEREKPMTVTEFLREVFPKRINDPKLPRLHWNSVVFKSTQLFPGIGGLASNDLVEGLSAIEKFLKIGINYSQIKSEEDNAQFNNAGRCLIISTTCNCHGVSTFIFI